jgi:hypothetical protein
MKLPAVTVIVVVASWFKTDLAAPRSILWEIILETIRGSMWLRSAFSSALSTGSDFVSARRLTGLARRTGSMLAAPLRGAR